MNIYLLLELIIIFFLISLAVTRDIFSPASIMCETYILAVFCAILNIDKWKVNLQNNTVFLIAFGVMSFVIVSLMVNVYYSKNYKKDIKNELNFIRYHKKTMFVCIVFQAICLLIYFYFFIKSLGDLSRYNSLNYLMRYFRFFVDIEKDIPIIVNQLLKYSKALAYIAGYMFIHNKIVERKTNRKCGDNYLVIPIILFSINSLLTAGRFEMMILILALMVMWYVIVLHYNDKKLTIYTVFKLFFVLILAIFLFSFTKTIVGRQGNGTLIDDFVDYFGGSIESFDTYLQNEIDKSNKEELFGGLFKFLRKLKLIDSKIVDTGLNEYVESNGIVVGNVYTGFRKMYHDFGMFGIMFFQMLMALVITIFYEKIKLKKEIDRISLSLIVYSAISFSIFLHSYSEFFFSTVISFNYLAFGILLYLIKFFVIKIRI